MSDDLPLVFCAHKFEDQVQLIGQKFSVLSKFEDQIQSEK